MGGAKVMDKLPIVQNLLPLADNMILSSGLGFTFLNELQGMPLGSSLFAPGQSKYIQQVNQEAKSLGVQLHLPEDIVITKFAYYEDYLKGGDLLHKAIPRIVDIDQGVPDGYMGLDIGPKSIQKFKNVISESLGIAFNGPSGLFENENYRAGTIEILQHISKMTQRNNAFVSVIGGGDSLNAIKYCGQFNQFSHLSTGGGASLEMLEGKSMPGIQALSERD